MRIGFIILTELNQLRADAIHVNNLLKEFATSDLQCEPLTCKPYGNRLRQRHLNFVVKMVTRLAFLLKIVAIRKRFDLFYLRDWLFAYLLSFCGVRYAFEVNGLVTYEGLIRNYFRPGSAGHRFFRGMERRVMRRAVKTVCVSAGMKEYCVGHGVRAGKILVAENAADLGVFNPNRPKTPIQARTNAVLIGWMGSFESHHGLEDLI